MPHTQYNELHRRKSVTKDNGKSPVPTGTELAYVGNPTRRPVDPRNFSSERTPTDFPWNFDPPRNPPALAPAGMPWTAPSPEIPNLPSDWWHNDTNITIVNGTGDLWSGDRIPFYPDHGRCTHGVSMKQARLAVGMSYGDTPLGKIVHQFLFNVPHPMLSIQWPGYNSVQESFYERKGLCPLNIKRPLYLDENVTLGQLGREVADHFFEFSQLYGEHCNPHDPKALLLGPGGISFDRLRLVKLWTSTHGAFWNAEVAIVDDYMHQF